MKSVWFWAIKDWKKDETTFYCKKMDMRIPTRALMG